MQLQLSGRLDAVRPNRQCYGLRAVIIVAESLGEIAFELAAVVGLPDQNRVARRRSDPHAVGCARRGRRWPKRCVHAMCVGSPKRRRGLTKSFASATVNHSLQAA